jgi:nucleoside-diphosphate-sugar epimerase|tara:strand:- start:368 stop:1291 length:924 start_codon:yes stop_codon:yes gene_type:complete
MKNVLVTGGAGYLGSLLCGDLLNLDYKVTILDKFKFGVSSILHIIDKKNLTVIRGDIRDSSNQSLLKKFDIIINLAGIVGYPACDEDRWEATSVNVDAVKEMSKMLSPNQLFIQPSTGSSYGKVNDICTEETPINPLTLYGSNKAEAEKYILDKNAISLRFATVYGASPRMRLDLFVNQIVMSAVKEKYYVMYQANASRTFLHSRDAVSSIIFSINNEKEMVNECFNVGDKNQNYTKLEVGNLIKKDIDFDLITNEFATDRDQRDYSVSYDKINKLGYKTNYTMEEGIHELIKISKILKEQSIYRNF